ncbi:right-handed parallel beta-helix repeat-containing protein [Sphingomonas colocasiae]|uniref:Right-handed parallel beta-helix repeat-containing protein n=2 Tax=Sphingomonas colocasiae TaxID=1848973 RepID=A0ABS7PYS0_9SPHN|nr:right-handed parallel beta-helix repeat-containing protein [Sphingomonas colocasiae]MBY8825795.1 right-handed parallel beta-helix repeat-containing protein [Sphingomonas colocasiae]
MRLPALLVLSFALAAPAASQSGDAPFTVAETGQSFATLQDAVSAIGDGTGTIRIAPGRYRDCAVQEGGSVSFVSTEPGKAIFESAICEGKATLVLRGARSRVEGIVFRHNNVPDGNGAGIRIEKGNLDVVNAMFLDSQCGILSASDPSSAIRIVHSTFSGLGKDPTGNGAHGVYIGDYGSLSIENSRFDRGTGGHYVKSRAPRVKILDSSFDDSLGQHTNYSIDLSNGATGRIAGNTFVVGPNKDNYSTIITVAPEGRERSSTGLVVEGNTATVAPGFKNRTTLVGNWTNDTVMVRGNTLGEQVAAQASR